MEKKWIKCNACGSDQFEPVSRKGELIIGLCRQCGLVYVNPMPFFDKHKNEFSEVSLELGYTQFLYRNTNSVNQEVLDFEKKQLSKQLEFVKLAGAQGKPSRFLDVGCATGMGVFAAREFGWEAVGIDIDPKLISLGREKFGVDLRCGTLDECRLPERHFNFVRLRDIVEHLPNPFEVLVEVKKLLAPGGVALLSLPNEDGLFNRIGQFFGLRKGEIARVFPPHHLHGFNPGNLRLMLERIGFQVLRIQTSSPLNSSYVTFQNVKRTRNPVRISGYRAASWVGRGSMLIGWVRRAA